MSAGKRYDCGDVPILHGSLSCCLFIMRCKRGGGGRGRGSSFNACKAELPSFPRRGTVPPKMPKQSSPVDASVPATEPRQQVVRAWRRPSHRVQECRGCARRRKCARGKRPATEANVPREAATKAIAGPAPPHVAASTSLAMLPTVLPPRIAPRDENWDRMHRPMETSVLGVRERSDIVQL